MNDVLRVEVGESKGYVIPQVYLNMKWNRSIRALQEISEVFVQQLHQENGKTRLWVMSYTEVLHHIGVPYHLQKLTFLHKPALDN